VELWPDEDEGAGPSEEVVEISPVELWPDGDEGEGPSEEVDEVEFWLDEGSEMDPRRTGVVDPELTLYGQ
jgi:hypothetical protein